MGAYPLHSKYTEGQASNWPGLLLWSLLWLQACHGRQVALRMPEPPGQHALTPRVAADWCARWWREARVLSQELRFRCERSFRPRRPGNAEVLH